MIAASVQTSADTVPFLTYLVHGPLLFIAYSLAILAIAAAGVWLLDRLVSRVIEGHVSAALDNGAYSAGTARGDPMSLSVDPWTEREFVEECRSWIATAHHRLEQGDVAAAEYALQLALDHAHTASTMRAAVAAKR